MSDLHFANTVKSKVECEVTELTELWDSRVMVISPKECGPKIGCAGEASFC
jgi:hypothetical protein